MLERFERFSLSITELSRYWHKISSDEMSKYDLKGTHSVYLMALYHYPEGVTASKLCQLSGKGKSDVSRLMSIMQEKGLVLKEGIYQNCYRGVYKLTDKGKEAAKDIKSRATLAVEIAGKDIDDRKRAVFYEVIESLCNNLKLIAENGLPEQN